MRRAWWAVVLCMSCDGGEPGVDPVDSDPVVEPTARDVAFEVPLSGDLTAFVDPLVGTQGGGNTIPGALVPHGMVRLSPDSVGQAGDIDAYAFDTTHLNGFTHTHLEGPGGSANGYSQVLVMPQGGEVVLNKSARAMPYTATEQVARPGYYSVPLETGQVELTATGHAAIHRYELPAGPSRLIVDLGHSQGKSVDGDLQLDGPVVRAMAEYNVHPTAALATFGDGRTAYAKVYAYMEASHDPVSVSTFREPRRAEEAIETEGPSAEGAEIGGVLEFHFDEPTVVELRVGISFIDVEQAQRNLDEEVGDATFEEVAQAASDEWNAMLHRVQIEADPTTKAVFYTALYRSYFQPADYTEAGGRYHVAASGEHVVRDAGTLRYYTDDWCMWDTFRTSHPFRTLVEPGNMSHMLSSMLVHYEEGGWLPKCTWHATGYSRVMTGNPANSIFADALVKGIDDIDVPLAWEAMKKLADEETPDLIEGICGYMNLGTPPDYLTLQYVPRECDPDQSVSLTLEYAFADYGVAKLAEHLGEADEAARYMARSDYWRNHFNPEHGFMQEKDRSGAFLEPFDPTNDGVFNGFVEADSWIYSFFVPHDLPGLAQAMGGEEVLVDRLDTFFDDGHFDVSNQPSYHTLWMYTHAGAPEKTHERVRTLLDDHFRMTPDGLPGNDDAGSTSVWGLLGILGLYPMAPGDPTWTLSAPRVERAEIHLHPGYYDGGTFVIETVGDPETMPYVASVQLDGAPYEGVTLSHARMAQGGTLTVTLSAEPTNWGR